jgi:nucleoside-diphosphate-sugar epimerase
MIVGNGMIAKSLSVIDNENFLFFASGVSNSLCTDEKEYEKEKLLLEKHINTDKKFIYFSSVNEYVINEKYLQHKLNIEKIITENTDNFIIFKISQLIGDNGNQNNFINFLYNNIINETYFNLIDTKRSLLCINDLVKICDYLCNIDYNGFFIINYIELLEVTDIIKIIEKITNKKSLINDIKKLSQNINSNSDYVNEVLDKLIDKNNYTEKLLIKKFKYILQ